MKRIFTIIVYILMATFIVGCSSADDVKKGNEIEDTDEIRGEQENDNDDPTSKESILEKYSDDLRIGDSQEWERSDGLSTDHIKLTVNSFIILDELEGEQPTEDQFLLVNVTVEDLLGDYNYHADLLKSSAYDSANKSYQNEKDELQQKLEPEGKGINTGYIVYDVPQSDYYRIHFFDNEHFLMFEDEQAGEDESVSKEATHKEDVLKIDIDQIEHAIDENDLLSNEIKNMEDASLDWKVVELLNVNNKSITFNKGKTFFTYYGKTNVLDMETFEFSDEIDIESDAQMVSYEDQLVFLDTDNEHIRLHFMDPSSEKVIDTVEEDLQDRLDFPLANVFLHEDQLIGMPNFLGNIYVFNLSEKTLENVIDVKELIGENDYVPFGFDDGLLYIGTQGLFNSLYAFDVDTEEFVWEIELGEDNVYTAMDNYPVEPIYDEDNMHVLASEEAYLEINKENGTLTTVGDFGRSTHLLAVTEENIFFSNIMRVADRSFMVSLARDTFQPNWALEIADDRTDLSAVVHEDYLYVVGTSSHIDSDGTYWYKIDIDSGEVLAKDTIEEMTNDKKDLVFEIYNGVMFISDGDTLAFTHIE